MRLFFVLLSAQACHIVCGPKNIEYSPNGVSYFNLEVYTQSLLDTESWVNFEELVDSMDLTSKWGKEIYPLKNNRTSDGCGGREKFLESGIFSTSLLSGRGSFRKIRRSCVEGLIQDCSIGASVNTNTAFAFPVCLISLYGLSTHCLAKQISRSHAG